ncbi:Uncharacterized protein TCM_034923 [Theobroma cacao]|uniref:Uncharacterized protein n=1 Tax=Theobroma cacao TaxID=3641 RepID=A0A061FGI3_THECC|nr:Uncharacterized protein TCM_034923 [Theobroma cacao]
MSIYGQKVLEVAARCYWDWCECSVFIPFGIVERSSSTPVLREGSLVKLELFWHAGFCLVKGKRSLLRKQELSFLVPWISFEFIAVPLSTSTRCRHPSEPAERAINTSDPTRNDPGPWVWWVAELAGRSKNNE